MARITKIRKEKLSIYLARDSHKPISELIRLDNVKRPIQLDLPDTELAELYIKIQPPKTVPPWTKMFTDSKQIESQEFGTSSNVGAVLVVRVAGSTFVLSFGMGFHLIKQEAIERDFGLKVTLNSVDPDKLRSLDKASYDHNPLNSRTQSTRDVDIFNLHLDSESEMLYAITGTSQVELFGSHVTGRDALTIAVETDLANLPKILLESVQRYRAKLPAKFSWVEDINRVRDLDEVEVLDMELDSHFELGQYDGFWLGEPEVVDWESQIGYSFHMSQRAVRHVVLSLNDYLVYLEGAVPSVEAMKHHVVHVNNSEYKSVKSWPVYRCLYAEISYGSDQYILRNGIWYKVNQDFVTRVDDYLASLNVHPYQFPIYNYDREEDY